MKVPVGVSNHHIHLTKEHYDMLFDEDIEVKYYLKQTGEFASNQKVSIKYGEKLIENVRLVGPFRKYTQVELLKTDCDFLGINPPVRNSGDLTNALTVTIITPKGSIEAVESTIIANRHIHFPNDLIKNTNYKDGDVVSVKTNDGKVLDCVHIKTSDKFVLEFHINKDDAINNNLENNEEVEIC